ncbi:MAG: hypothetical protein WBE76_06260 [Terracidiphilus sp.]
MPTAILTGIVSLSGAAAHGQFNLGASFYRTFTQSSTGNGTVQTPTDSYGGMLEARKIRSPFVGYEFGFALAPDNQSFTPKTGACGFVCENKPTDLTSKDLEFAGDWILSAKVSVLRPFVLGGLGVVVSIPSNGALDTNTTPRVAYVGGGGADIAIQRRYGLRLQYRDSFFKAPNLLPVYVPTGKYTQIAEPMFGFYINFGTAGKAH